MTKEPKQISRERVEGFIDGFHTAIEVCKSVKFMKNLKIT